MDIKPNTELAWEKYYQNRQTLGNVVEPMRHKDGFAFTRTDYINHLTEKHGYVSYLEVGVQYGNNYHQVRTLVNTGFEPEPKGAAALMKGVKAIDSDTGFKRARLNKQRFDIIFIDGLHESDQVAKDLNNSLKCLNPGGTIVMHDCVPTTLEMQQVPRMQKEWTGDVWRVWVEAVKRFGDKAKCYDSDYGVGVIENLP